VNSPGRTSSSIRIVLADDEELVRTGLRMILGSEPDLDVVGEASDGDQTVRRVLELDPDVLLLDLRMPVRDGLWALGELSDHRTRVVVLTTFDTDANLQQALLAGAAGFLLKDAPADQLVAAIRAAAAGDAVLAPSVVRRMVRDLVPLTRPAVPAILDPLTERERDVLVLMADGCSNSEIGERLHVTEGTVKTHVARILMKLGVRDRLQAVVLAYRSGAVRP
jgi:DNA-binding NarL/FixJ family response regulator